MDDIVTPTDARRVARTFLANVKFWDCEHGDGPQLRLSGQMQRLWLADNIPLYEFEIITNKGRRSGFILVPGSRKRPPILEYCRKGQGFSSTIRRAVAHFLRHERDPLARKAKTAKLYYLGPFDIVAEIKKGKGEYKYVRVPNATARDSSRKLTFELRVKPDDPDYDAHWAHYLGGGGFPEFKCLVLKWHTPRRYNQTYRGKCISGCSPVAWAVLASSFETYYNDFSRMQRDEAHFQIEWAWSVGDTVVDAIIWDAHAYLSTDCGGNTYTIRLPSGGQIFNRWGYNCTFGQAPCSVLFLQDILTAGFTCMLSAQSHWNPNREAGHSVVVFGVNTTMFSDHVLICMGWGTDYENKWISMSQLRDPYATYLSSIRLRGSRKPIAKITKNKQMPIAKAGAVSMVTTSTPRSS
jgi:hypothetical protein